MSELVSNGGFETAGATAFDAADWTRVQPANAFRLSDPSAAHSGSAGGGVISAPAGGPPLNLPAADGRLQQSVSVVPGGAYQFSAWLKRASGVHGVEIVDTSSGAVLGSIADIDGTGDWQSVSSVITPSTGSVALEIRGLASPTFSTSWYVDDVSLQVVPGSLHMQLEPLNLYKAMYTQAQTIKPSNGYYTDAGNRVITRYVRPGEPGAPELPYICLPLEDTVEPAMVDEGSHIKFTLRQPIYLFYELSEHEGIDVDSPAILGLKCMSDLLRCVMPDSGSPWWTLNNNKVRDVTIAAKRGIGERIETVPGHVMLAVDIQSFMTRETLGPNA